MARPRRRYEDLSPTRVRRLKALLLARSALVGVLLFAAYYLLPLNKPEDLGVLLLVEGSDPHRRHPTRARTGPTGSVKPPTAGLHIEIGGPPGRRAEQAHDLIDWHLETSHRADCSPEFMPSPFSLVVVVPQPVRELRY